MLKELIGQLQEYYELYGDLLVFIESKGVPELMLVGATAVAFQDPAKENDSLKLVIICTKDIADVKELN